MSKKIKYHIGIDPDVTASGVCVWNSQTETIERLQCLSFFKLCKLLESYAEAQAENCMSVHVVIDAGWLNRSNFHARTGVSHKANAIIGERTGANHETGKKIAEMCDGLELSREFHRPTRSKVNAEYFSRLTGWGGRTNQELRDAAMLVYGR